MVYTYHIPHSNHDRDNVGLTPLHHACIDGKAHIVAILLKLGLQNDKAGILGGENRLSFIDVNARDDFGESSLHKACTRGWEQVVRLLLHAGVNTNVSDKAKGSGKTSGDPETMRTYIERRSTIPSRSFYLPPRI